VQSRRAFLGEIAANIAHEVRTPLAVLKTSAQLLGRQELPRDEQRRLATNVAAEVDRLNGVVTSLVDLARPTPVRYRGEPLGDVVDRAVGFFTPEAAKLGVAISRTVDDSVRVCGSAEQLHQVFLNGISNALQAMGGPGQLCVRCYRDDGWGIVDIEDTGPGFAPEVLARAFAPFHTTKAHGAGLGLAISRRIVEEHGGTIAAENPPGGGARLRIRLPHRPDAP
jgi:signal transduction histidine kinase